MSKTILTLDEINLLLSSEEPKNEKLYGNLYKVLVQLKPTKALSETQTKLFDATAMSALTYNKKSLIDTVVQEWYAERVIKEDPTKKVKCGLCNTPNKYLYYICNRRNGNVLNVGSSCINNFKGIENYIEQKQQLSNIIKNQKAVARRNKFHQYFPDVEDIIFECEKYNDSIPIALPYTLQDDLSSTITRLRKIYNIYVDSGKKPYKSEKDSFELFQININHFNKIKQKVNDCVHKNISLPYICERREVEWLKRNNKLHILKKIQENGGFYSIATLGMISSYNFVKDNFVNILCHEKTYYVTIHNLEEASDHIDISFQKIGYDYPIIGTIGLCEFMKNIGANCLFDSDYHFMDKDILSIASIKPSIYTIQSILNYIYNMLEKLHCVFLIDDKMELIVLFRRKDRAIRYFQPQNFVKNYISHILKEDQNIYDFLQRIINKPTVKWIYYDEQKKYGIDETIGKMYKEQYLAKK